MKTAHIVVPVADIHKEHTFASEVVTQALMYEKVTILDTYDNWSRIEQWDNYQGWINNFYLDQNIFEIPSYQYKGSIIVSSRFLKIYSEDVKSWVDNNEENLISNYYDTILPYGTKIPYLRREKKYFFEIPWINNSTKWIYNQVRDDKRNTIYKDDHEKHILEFTKYDSASIREYKGRHYALTDMDKLLGVPYKWGGKSSFGFDCSGFVQTVFRVNGVLMPRDSKDQYEIVKNHPINNWEESDVGSLVFFKEDKTICHVGITQHDRFIHSSGLVKYNSFNNKDELFDKKLMDKFAGIFSISEIIKEQLNERK